ATGTRQMINRHPWYAQLVHTRPPAGPHMMRRTEFMLAVLAGVGVEVAAAMAYAALLDRHVFGSGLQEAAEAEFDRRAGLTDPAVPTCPEWTVGDLVRHVANGYLNVVVRQLRLPAETPVRDLGGTAPLAALDSGYPEMLAEFARRDPEDPAGRFWLRRMAHET